MIVDDAGEIEWVRAASPDSEVFDFRVQRYKGMPVLTWWEGITNVGGGAGVKVDLPAGRYYLHEYNPTASLKGTYSLVVSKVAGGTPTTVSVKRSLATAFTPAANAMGPFLSGTSSDPDSVLVSARRTHAVWSDVPVQ